MPAFDTARRVPFAARQMFDLVADVEQYPQFLPMCRALTVRSRRERGGSTVLLADMTVGYKAITESFTSQVHLKPEDLEIDVQYVDGPFRYLRNEWRFVDLPDGGSEVRFHIDYEFKSRMLGALMGAMFDRGFRMFADAFEKRALEIYGKGSPESA